MPMRTRNEQNYKVSIEHQSEKYPDATTKNYRRKSRNSNNVRPFAR